MPVPQPTSLEQQPPPELAGQERNPGEQVVPWGAWELDVLGGGEEEGAELGGAELGGAELEAGTTTVGDKVSTTVCVEPYAPERLISYEWQAEHGNEVLNLHPTPAQVKFGMQHPPFGLSLHGV
jgi:hypothetical protein